MNYRTATLENLPILLEFGKQLSFIEASFDKTITYDEEEAKQRYISQLANPLAIFLMAEDEELRPAGYLYAHVDLSGHIQQGEIEVVFISEKYRRQGISQELITRALQWMQDHKVARVLTHIFAENLPSRKVFEKLGFEPHNIEYLLEKK